jgi:GNAT superfamily N-acetyltransferase
VRARAELGVVGRLRECRPDWCLMEVGGYRGWVDAHGALGRGAGRKLRLTARIAVTVVDRYQRRGLGTLLMGCLARVARHNGIDRLEGHVTRNNHRMLTLLHDLGARREIGPDASVHRVVLDLKDDPADYPDTAAGDAFRRAYALTRVTPP